MIEPQALKFFDPNLESLIAAFRDLAVQDHCRVELRPFNQLAREFVRRVFPKAAEFHCSGVFESCLSLPEAIRVGGDGGSSDITILCSTDENEVSTELMTLVEVERRTVLAPITNAYFKRKPLFLISIPKGGTHLLYSLVEAFGYEEGLVCRDSPIPGRWYCLEFTNSHTSARDFFVDTVRRSPFGNRLHPFPWCPAIFIYRNPLDIVVSEANYYHKDGKTVFHGYLEGLSFAERLLRLINDPWLLGSIRDRIGNFVAWLDFPNVAPISFEELVGPNGGGSREAQVRAIWSLQLKLHVPGNPHDISARVFDESSPTFYSGQIGAYRKSFTENAYREFESLPQDFMEAMGYPLDYKTQVCRLPQRYREFAKRQLRFSSANFDEVPILIDRDYLGHTIIRYQKRFYGVEKSERIGCLSELKNSRLAELPSSNELLGVQAKIINGKPAEPLRKPGLLWDFATRLASIAYRSAEKKNGKRN